MMSFIRNTDYYIVMYIHAAMSVISISENGNYNTTFLNRFHSMIFSSFWAHLNYAVSHYVCTFGSNSETGESAFNAA